MVDYQNTMSTYIPLTLLFDQDGVLADFETGFLDLWKAHHPEKFYIPVSDRRTFYCDEEYPPEFKEDIRFLLRHPDLFINLPVIPGAQDMIDNLLVKGVDVQICTSPLIENEFCASQKIEWVRKHFSDDMAKRMIITKDKGYVIGDYLVDDKPEPNGYNNPRRVWEHIIMDAPYNREVKGKRRVMNWTDRSYLKVLNLED